MPSRPSRHRRVAALVTAVGLVGLLAVAIVPAMSRPAAADLTGGDGTLYAFGDAPFLGGAGDLVLARPLVAMAAGPAGDGYWLAASDGGVFSYGTASFFGSTGGMALNQPIVAIAAHPSGNGYWLVASDGGVFSFGAAGFHGSTGSITLNRPIVGIAATASGNGYWLVASDGGVFAFGDAPFAGSTGGIALNRPVVGMAANPSGNGYWLVASDGGLFAFGGAPFAGSTGAIALNQPVVAMAARAEGGYWLFARDGGTFAFGGAPFVGSTGGSPPPFPVVGAAATPSGDGYWLVTVGRVGGAPALSVTQVLGGLANPWDVGFTPDASAMFFTERPGRISVRMANGTIRRPLAGNPTDVRVAGEGGMLGLVVDPAFVFNRWIYVCFDSNALDVRVVRFRVDDDFTTLTDRTDLVTGMPYTTGRHSGCRPRFGPDGYLWVGTGDSANYSQSQDTSSLGGKVLRIDRDGNPAPGNPFGTAVYTYGHRNVQGLAFRPGTGQAYDVEHGPTRDDEVNLLTGGANYGWSPRPTYDENVPMTFPGATPAVWSSGSPTIAPSGATFLSGAQWRDWDGALATAVLKGEQLRLLFLDAPGTDVVAEIVLFQSVYGRLRTAVQGPDGSLYVTTDNGSGDVILRITPS